MQQLGAMSIAAHEPSHLFYITDCALDISKATVGADFLKHYGLSINTSDPLTQLKV